MEKFPSCITRETGSSNGLSYLRSNNSSDRLSTIFLCFHGWACSATDFAPLISALSSDAAFSGGNYSIAIDLPGHGESPKTICPRPGVASFAALANHLRHELSLNGELPNTVLVGHSMGCRMAVEAFSQLKTNVSGIVLLDGSWVGRDPEIHAAPVTEQKAKEIQRISDRIGMYGPLTPESFQQEMEKRLENIDLEYEYELSREYIEWDRENMEKVLDSIGASVGVRVLAVQSTQGRGAHRRALNEGEEGPWVALLRSKIGERHLQVATLQGCGHWPHVDKPEIVAQIILSGLSVANQATLSSSASHPKLYPSVPST